VGSSLKPKVARPSMLGIGCPGSHALLLTPPKNAQTVTRAPPARAGSFMGHEHEWYLVGRTAASPLTAEDPVDESHRGFVPQPDLHPPTRF
jgi:hypothetical protein